MIGRHHVKWTLGQLNRQCIPTLAPKSGGDDSVADSLQSQLASYCVMGVYK